MCIAMLMGESNLERRNDGRALRSGGDACRCAIRLHDALRRRHSGASATAYRPDDAALSGWRCDEQAARKACNLHCVTDALHSVRRPEWLVNQAIACDDVCDGCHLRVHA